MEVVFYHYIHYIHYIHYSCPIGYSAISLNFIYVIDICMIDCVSKQTILSEVYFVCTTVILRAIDVKSSNSNIPIQDHGIHVSPFEYIPSVFSDKNNKIHERIQLWFDKSIFPTRSNNASMNEWLFTQRNSQILTKLTFEKLTIVLFHTYFLYNFQNNMQKLPKLM